MSAPEELSVEHFFDGIAPRYDEVARGIGWSANGMLYKELQGYAPLPSYVLDLGAGTGLTAEVILEVAKPEQLVAVDVSAEMLERLQQRCKNDPRVVIARMAVGQYLAETQSHFDLIVAMGLLHFIPDSDSIISGSARVLDQGGRFIFTYDPIIPGHSIHGEAQTKYDVTVYRRDPNDVLASVRASGLDVVSHELFVTQPTGNAEYRNGLVVAQKKEGGKVPKKSN